MAERKAVNKYYPPEWEPKHGSINTFRKQHPLRERAKKIKEGILVIRFEMPYNVWCGHCEAHIGKGVRYNAEKKCVGKYFSTKIWQFRMRCHLCSGMMEIHTDPENRDYRCVSGVKRKEETWEAGVEAGTIKIADDDHKQKLETDPLYKLEHLVEDERKAAKANTELQDIIDFNDRREDDYSLNCKARDKFRVKRKEREELDEEAEQRGLGITLQPVTESQKEAAKLTSFQRPVHKAREGTSTKRSRIFNSTERNSPQARKLELLKKRRKLDPSLLRRRTSSSSSTGSSSTSLPSIGSFLPVQKSLSS